MKRLQFLKYAFIATVTALLLTGGVAAQESCEAANALLNATLYEKAQANYTDLLMKYPNLTCAQDGVLKAQNFWAINLYEIGQAYENASQFQEARIEYAGVLKKYPSYIPAQEALEKVSDDKFAAVQTLANLGYYNEAAIRLKKVVEDNPGISVPKDLDYLPGRSLFLWGDIRNLIEIWGQPLVEIAIFVLGLYVLRFRIWPLIKGFFKPKLDIRAFDDGATELKIGTGMMAMVEGSLMRLGRELGQEHVHIVDGDIENLNKIPADIKGVSPQIMIISNLIEWIVPPNVITVSGYLEKPGNCGAGLTLSMVKNQTGEIMGNITIWQKDFDTTINSVVDESNPANYYDYLVDPAAIWILFQLNGAGKDKKIRNYIRSHIPSFLKNYVKDKEKFVILGTDNWESYAHFNAGVIWQLEGKKNNARQQYVFAQNHDMNNYGALVNLGYLDIEDKKYDRAIERLSNARKMADKYLFSWSRSKFAEENKVRLIKSLIQKYGIDWVKPEEIKEKKYCMTIEGTAGKKSVTLKLDNEKTKVSLEIGDVRMDEFIVKEENDELNIYETSKKFHRDPVWYVATYQLASTYHYMSLLLREKVDIDKAIKCLHKAEKEAKNLLKTIREEKLFESIEPNASIMHASILVDLAYQGEIDESKIEEAESKINSIESMYSKLAPRVRYNLACYYSIVGDNRKEDQQTNYKKALENLEYAIEGGGEIIQWAKIDPSLKGAREFKETEVDFAKLIKKYEQKYESPRNRLIL